MAGLVTLTPPSTSSYCQSLTLAGGLRRSRLPSCHRGATWPSWTLETRPAHGLDVGARLVLLEGPRRCGSWGKRWGKRTRKMQICMFSGDDEATLGGDRVRIVPSDHPVISALGRSP